MKLELVWKGKQEKLWKSQISREPSWVGHVVRLVAVAGALLATSTVLASCSEGDGPQTSGSASATPSSSAGPTSIEYPRVQTPLDPSPYLDNPCQLVPMRVLNSIAEFREGDPDTDSAAAKKMTGPRCTWLPRDLDGPTVGITIGTVRRATADEGYKGLEIEYRSKESGDIDHLQPLAIPGHPGNPAVISGQAVRINNGSCPVTVGLADDLTFTARVIDREDPQGACEGAQKVAAAVLDTLAGGK